ncbi:MAG: hypothetical protein ABWZ88_03660 [Variovorax sp.]
MPEDDRLTPLQLLKGLAILALALCWPLAPLLAAAFGLYEVYKLAVLDEWDDVWQLLIGPCVIGAALWYRFGRSRQFERGGSNWMPQWVEDVFTTILVICLVLFVVALVLDIRRP